jgi:membrane protease YdiL (CAAX protease family)
MIDPLVGKSFGPSKRLGCTMFILALLAGGCDLWLAREPEDLLTFGVRPILLLIALLVFLHLLQGNLKAMGLQPTAKQSLGYWVRVTVGINCIVVLVCIAVAAGLLATGHKVPVYPTSPSVLGTRSVAMCLYYPILEEGIYRLILCIGVAMLFGRWTAILISGLAFALLHWIYGDPSPENQIAGFLLAWTFFKSETIVVPLALHALGNVGALAIQLVTWYYLQSGINFP